MGNWWCSQREAAENFENGRFGSKLRVGVRRKKKFDLHFFALTRRFLALHAPCDVFRL